MSIPTAGTRGICAGAAIATPTGDQSIACETTEPIADAKMTCFGNIWSVGGARPPVASNMLACNWNELKIVARNIASTDLVRRNMLVVESKWCEAFQQNGSYAFWVSCKSPTWQIGMLLAAFVSVIEFVVCSVRCCPGTSDAFPAVNACNF